MRPTTLDMKRSLPSPRARICGSAACATRIGADSVQVEQSQQFGQWDGLHRGIEDLGGVDDDDVDVTRGRERRGHAVVVGDVEGQPLVEVEVFKRARIAAVPMTR